MRKDGVCVILFRDDSRKEVFLVLRSDYPIWGLTEGGMEKGEEPEETAVREAFEETGFKVKLLRKVGVYEFSGENGKLARTNHLYEGRVISGEFKPEYPDCKGQWFPVDRLPVNVTYRTREKIKDCLKYSGQPFLKTNCKSFGRSDLLLFFHHPVASTRFLLARRK